MSSRYLNVTDRQTDESNLITALCTSASRGKNMAVVVESKSATDCSVLLLLLTLTQVSVRNERMFYAELSITPTAVHSSLV